MSQKTKVFSARTLGALSYELNAFYAVCPTVFATQVFQVNEGVEILPSYEALVYYKETS